MVENIKKRDGKIVCFDKSKIVKAIMAAMKESEIIDYEFANKVADDISKQNDEYLEVEQVQDMVEDKLMKVYPMIARKYILYRNQRTKVREMKSDLMKHIKEKVTSSNIQSSNANVDENSFGARKNEAAGVMTKSIAVEEMLDPDVKEAWENNLLYLHDLTEYVIGQHNCLNIDLYKLLSKGFYTRNGGIRPARSFATACQLVAVIFQANSQTHFGGVGSVELDKQLAPFVRISFLKHFKDGLKYVESKENKKTWEEFEKEYKEVLNTASICAPANIFKDYSDKAYDYAIDMLEREGKQATQALYHNLNSLESRPGSQLAFVSINVGLDTSYEGRCIVRWLFEASIDGIGPYNQTSIFPISIFRYKKDINDRPGTPNYDLFKLAIKSLSKRIYPNIVNCDWVSNQPDINPTYLISQPILDDSCVVRVFHNNTSFHTSIKKFVNQLKDDNYDVSFKDDMYYIDLRFLENPYYVLDQDNKYNDYADNLKEFYAKINYISFNEDMTRFAITTDTFRHDFINKYQANDVYQSEHFNYKYNSSTEMATMGCVDGKEVITYKYNGQVVTSSIEKLYSQLIGEYRVWREGRSSYIDFDWPVKRGSLYVYDSSIKNWSRVKKFICNDDLGNWYEVKYCGEKENYAASIFLTGDHPLPTQRGRIFVKDLKEGDRIFDIRKRETKEENMFIIQSVTFIGSRLRFGYDFETESDRFDVNNINSYNCRTMIGYDRHGFGWDKNGRGNVTPVTMNITKLAIKHGICLGERDKADLEGFENDLDKLLKIAEKSLLDRYQYICSQSPSAAYFMYGNGTIVDADKSLEKGTVEPSMKHNTLSIGFLGLANTLYALFGKYHNQSKEVLEYGLKIVDKIYKYTKEAAIRNNLNFSCYFTPAESCCYTIMKKLQKEFGIIKGVTDHEYLINSVHVPPYEKISIKDKIDIESKFDWMGTAGHILYVELDASTMKNLDAIESIIHYAMDNNEHHVGYFAINFPIDNCLKCGYSGVMEDEKCPICGASGEDIQMLRRVTGYLTADYKTRFNKGKRAEVEERIKHSRYTNMNSLMHSR